MSEERPESHSSLYVVAWLFALLVCLVFLPLGIAAGEHFILGSDHFEDLCHRVGVYDTLDRIYRPVIDLDLEVKGIESRMDEFLFQAEVLHAILAALNRSRSMFLDHVRDWCGTIRQAPSGRGIVAAWGVGSVFDGAPAFEALAKTGPLQG